MGCKGSKYDVEAAAAGKKLEIVLPEKKTSAPETTVVLGWAPIRVGEAFDTPYGKGVVEELKLGEDSDVTYAVIRLGAGFVSVPEETARQWKSKASMVQVGDAFDTPYGKGSVEELKLWDGDTGITYVVVRLTSGFVNVPESMAGAWKAASTEKAASPASEEVQDVVLAEEVPEATIDPIELAPEESQTTKNNATTDGEAVIQGDEASFQPVNASAGFRCTAIPACACENK